MAADGIAAQEDLVGLDRLARSLARQLSRMPTAGLVAIHGAPGSAKRDFLRSLGSVVNEDARDMGLKLYPQLVWFDAWSWSRQGHVLAGLVSRVARLGPGGAAMQERARDVVAQLNRLTLDGSMPSGPGPAFNEGELEPVERLQRGFAGLVSAAHTGRGGRLLICVEGLDRLRPEVRWEVLDGLRLLLAGQPEVAVLVSIGREAAAMAVRHQEGDLHHASVDRVLGDLFDLSITVPPLEVRRIGSMVRRYLGEGEEVVRTVFGPDAVTGLSAAVAHRPLGAPRFVFRLAQRVLMLAEYAAESQQIRELTESQWCWVIVSERWPAFRRLMIRGGARRWASLRQTVAAGDQPYGALADEAISEQLTRDPILADYLRLHTDGFERDSEGIVWLDNLLLQAGL
jgi:hypothetical protein